jgi:hypothetical protein
MWSRRPESIIDDSTDDPQSPTLDTELRSLIKIVKGRNGEKEDVGYGQRDSSPSRGVRSTMHVQSWVCDELCRSNLSGCDPAQGDEQVTRQDTYMKGMQCAPGAH